MTTAVSRHSLSHGVFPSYNHFPICGQFCICYQFCEDCFSKESPANKYHSWNDHWKSEDVMLALHYSAWTFESVFLKLRYIGVCKHLLNFKVNFTISPICWGYLPVTKVQYLDSVSSSHRERNWKQEPQFAQCTISLLNFRLFPTACVECVECEEQMLPLYLSLLMASVTPRDGQINFTNVTPLFSAAIKPSADLTFDAAVMGTGTWWT